VSEYIKKWYEDKYMFKPKIKEIHHVDVMKFFNNKMDDTIQNGVKYINRCEFISDDIIETAIQNGVKEVEYYDGSAEVLVNDAIEKGIKETRGWAFNMRQISVEDTIENGVKDSKGIDFNEDIDDVIENGVKYMMSGSEFKNNQVEDIIKYSEKL
jgi:predicted peroxiredoxin